MINKRQSILHLTNENTQHANGNVAAFASSQSDFLTLCLLSRPLLFIDSPTVYHTELHGAQSLFVPVKESFLVPQRPIFPFLEQSYLWFDRSPHSKRA